ncbi:MAG: hypothetical protein R2713_15805 [Ilumatobacteraceae bacterium]
MALDGATSSEPAVTETTAEPAATESAAPSNATTEATTAASTSRRPGGARLVGLPAGGVAISLQSGRSALLQLADAQMSMGILVVRVARRQERRVGQRPPCSSGRTTNARA